MEEKGLRLASRLCFAVMVLAAVGLVRIGALFSSAPLVVIVQVGALALMLWARITFGRRSFHVAANPTEGGLVTAGPYRYLRHPIYTAACVLTCAGVAAHLSVASVLLAAAVIGGAMGRMLAEEHLLRRRYPEYAGYAARTARMVPYVF